MQIHKLTVPHLTNVQHMTRRSVKYFFINVCIYLLKLIHIKQAYRARNANPSINIHCIAKLLNYKHFSAGVQYAAPYAHKYIQRQVSAINVLKTN